MKAAIPVAKAVIEEEALLVGLTVVVSLAAVSLVATKAAALRVAWAMVAVSEAVVLKVECKAAEASVELMAVA